MSLKFICPSCHHELVLGYVRAGESYMCRHCHSADLVPDNAVETDEPLTVASEIPRPKPVESVAQVEDRAVFETSSRGFAGHRVFSIVGIAFNAVYILVSVLGFAMMADQLTPLLVFFIFLYLGTAAWTIVVLSGHWLDSRKGAMAANLALMVAFQVLVALLNDAPDKRIGAIAIIVVGLVSFAALAVCTRDSWLALRIERSRLEEMQKVAQLRSQIDSELQSLSQGLSEKGIRPDNKNA